MENHGQNRGGSPGCNEFDFVAIAAELRSRIEELESSIDAPLTIVRKVQVVTVADEAMVPSEAVDGIQDPMCNCDGCKAERRRVESRNRELYFRCGNPRGLHIRI